MTAAAAAAAGALRDVDLEEGATGGGNQGSGASRDINATRDEAGMKAGDETGAQAEEAHATPDQQPVRQPEGDVEAGTYAGSRRRPPDGVMGDAMAGVGEDEKPYNYICNLDKVNLGGPGWFNDVFKLSIEVDSDRTWLDTLALSLVPRQAFRRHCKLLNTRQHVTGSVTVEAPPNKRVWLSGVTVTFEEHLMTVDSDGGELVGALEAQVALGQYISGKTTFTFDLDLDLLDEHRHWPVRETYVGELMALRHRIIVAAQRPWYTFNVYGQVPIAMECLSLAPDEDAGQDNEEGGPNHVLVISDCNGRCEFDFGVDSFNLGDTLSGVVRFSDIASPIVSAHVMLLKAEFMYGEASEVLVAEHTILGPKRRRTEPVVDPALSEQERMQRQFMSPFVEQKHAHFVHTQEDPCQAEEVVGDAELPVEIPLYTLALSPSHMSLTQDIDAVNDEAELVGVRYYIRLILEDTTQAAFWHTHEIFFHRALPSPSSALAPGDSASEAEDSYDSAEQGGGTSTGPEPEASSELGARAPESGQPQHVAQAAAGPLGRNGHDAEDPPPAFADAHTGERAADGKHLETEEGVLGGGNGEGRADTVIDAR